MKSLANYLITIGFLLFILLLLSIFSQNIIFIAITIAFLLIGLPLFLYSIFLHYIKRLKNEKISSRELNKEEERKYAETYKKTTKDSKVFELNEKEIGNVIVVDYKDKLVAIPNIIKQESKERVKEYLLTLPVLNKRNVYLKLKKEELPIFKDIIIQEQPKVYLIPSLNSIKDAVKKRIEKELLFLLKKEVKKGYDIAQLKSKREEIMHDAIKQISELSLLKLCLQTSFLCERKGITPENEYNSFLKKTFESVFKETISKIKIS